jgi:hypothetical protein
MKKIKNKNKPKLPSFDLTECPQLKHNIPVQITK